MNKKMLKNQKGGTAVLMVVLMMSSFLVVTLTMSDLVINGFRLDKTRLDSTKAFYAAESGAERILWEVRKNGHAPGEGQAGDFCDVRPADFCFDSVIGGLVDDCLAVSTCGIDTQRLTTNGSEYSINFDFEETGANSTTTLKSVGVFKDVQRVIELKYTN